MSKVVRLFTSKHTRGFAACSLAVVVLIVFSLVAPYLCQHDAELANLTMANRAPGGEYLLGTDSLGRCILCRVLTGLQTTVFAALAVVAFSAGNRLGYRNGIGLYRRCVRCGSYAYHRCVHGVSRFDIGYCRCGSSGRRFAECRSCFGGFRLDALCALGPLFSTCAEGAPLHTCSHNRRLESRIHCAAPCAAQHFAAPCGYRLSRHRWLHAEPGWPFVLGPGGFASFAGIGSHDQPGGSDVPNGTVGGVCARLCDIHRCSGVQLVR